MNYQFSFGTSTAHQADGRDLMRVLGDFFFLIVFFVLVAAWLISWAAFHVAGGMIHLILVLALISLIVHFVRGPSAA